MHDNEPEYAPCCSVCGCEKEWEPCAEIDCEDGYYEDDDGVNYWGRHVCATCNGRGGYWVCPNVPHKETAKRWNQSRDDGLTELEQESL